MGLYGKVFGVFLLVATLYLIIGSSVYSFLARGLVGLKLFWQHVPPVILTSLATASSMATLPTTLRACERIGVSKRIRSVVASVGATVHMDGSCLSAALKVYVLTQIYGLDISGFEAIAYAVFLCLMHSVVMSGIPGGGYIGEAVIVSAYALPPEAIAIVAVIGTIVDIPATIVNTCGDVSASMLLDPKENDTPTDLLE